jgi:hypothetical protein
MRDLAVSGRSVPKVAHAFRLEAAPCLHQQVNPDRVLLSYAESDASTVRRCRHQLSGQEEGDERRNFHEDEGSDYGIEGSDHNDR